MAYFAALVARSGRGWKAREVDVADLVDPDMVADLLRDASADGRGGAAVLLVEREDEWFGVARLDADDELRVFVSDGYAAARSDLGPVLVPTAADQEVADEAPTGGAGPEDEEVSDGASVRIAVPAGDADLLADLGTPGPDLLELCEEEGVLPAEALVVLAENAGFADVYEALR